MCELYPHSLKNDHFQTQPYQWSLKDVDAPFIEQLKHETAIATLKYCQQCRVTENEFKLYSCVGCKQAATETSYYCSRECQKKDWKSHKSTCGAGPTVSGHLTSLYSDTKAWRRGSKKVTIRAVAINDILNWASEMLLQNWPLEERKDLCIQFVFDGICTHLDPWVFRGVHVYTMDWTQPRLKAMANLFGFQPQYELVFGENKHGSLPIRPYPPLGCQHSMVYVPQWPWILAQLCILDDNKSPWVWFQRLRFIMASIENSSPTSPFHKWLNTFAAPTKVIGYPWPISRFDEWQSKMGKVLCF